MLTSAIINEPHFECEISTRGGDMVYEQHATRELRLQITPAPYEIALALQDAQ